MMHRNSEKKGNEGSEGITLLNFGFHSLPSYLGSYSVFYIMFIINSIFAGNSHTTLTQGIVPGKVFKWQKKVLGPIGAKNKCHIVL